METKVLKGTTTICLTCKDGVVFACDKRASMGTFIASKDAKKVFNVNGRVAATIAGSVGDAGALIRLIKAEAALYHYNNKKVMSTKAIANLLSNILQGNKVFPYLVQLLIGGIDKTGARLFTLDPIGGLIEEKFAATGSGSPVAYGLLERDYSENTSVAENLPIAVRALHAAMQRDSATGDGMSLATITTKEGFRQFDKGEVKKLVKAIIIEKDN